MLRRRLKLDKDVGVCLRDCNAVCRSARLGNRLNVLAFFDFADGFIHNADNSVGDFYHCFSRRLDMSLGPPGAFDKCRSTGMCGNLCSIGSG